METYNLTTPQQNLYNLQKFYEETAVSNLCGVIFYRQNQDMELLQKSLNALLKKQTGLRLRFDETNGNIRQYVADYQEEVFPVAGFTTDAEFEAYANDLAKCPISLAGGKQYFFCIVEVEGRVGIVALLSHLIADGWTYGLIAKLVDEEYRHLAGELTEVDETVYDYRDFIKTDAEYALSERCAGDKAFWKKKYSGGFLKTTIKQQSGTTNDIRANRYTRVLPHRLTQGLNDYCAAKNLTPAVVFETALIIYLKHINHDNATVTVGTPVLNRMNAFERKIAGMFVSTLPLSVEVVDDVTVEKLARTISREHISLFRHQKYPYAEILRSIRENYEVEGNLYDVIISYQNAKTFADADTIWYGNGACEVPLEIHIDDRDDRAAYTINFDYQMAAFSDEREIALLAKRLEWILEQITVVRADAVSDISVLPKAEMREIVNEFNDTAVGFPKDKCVHELFMEQAKRTPTRVALVFEDRRFTYRELDEMSNAVANRLRENGVGRGDIVPIIAVRSWHIIVAMLGILKAGAAYMPVSPDYPKGRVDYVLREASCTVAFVYRYRKMLANVKTLDLANMDYETQTEPLENINRVDDLCYVIFTSGSTGTPKGLCIAHRNIANFSAENQFNIRKKILHGEESTFLSITNVIFDMFMTEFYIPLLSGGCLAFANEEECVSQKALEIFSQRVKPTVFETTPSKLRMLLGQGESEWLQSLQAIILGGEPLTNEMLKYVSAKTNAKIFNNYGPAETTVWSSIARVTDEITIGKPIANTQIYILNHENSPCPIGVAGELCIAGDGVGLGYLNPPELTAEKFVKNPFANEENHYGKTMYRTGDLARWRADGQIEYLGRIDTQVKIRGLRIELGEIENVMAEVDGIELCAVADKKDESGRQYLVGYYTEKQGGISDETAVQNAQTNSNIENEIRIRLQSKLPRYMIPNYFVKLETFPMTPSGKLDRKNLPTPTDFGNIMTEYVAPRNEIETIFCDIAKDVLDMDEYGIRHDFFENGGDSLRAIEFVMRAESEGIDLKLQMLFDNPTIEELAKAVAGNENRPKAGVVYSAERFQKYERLLQGNRLENLNEIREQKIQTVLLTGATGFLGAHILDELLRTTDATVYCLVRGDIYRRRLSDTLRYYFGDVYENMIDERIIPLAGDIVDENIFSDKSPKEAPDFVIHAAATVKHYGKYEYFHRVNTLGTKHVAEYAKSVGTNFIVISTISVSGNSFADAFDTEVAEDERYFSERSLYQGQSLENVYVRSKFEAECAVLDLMLDGLNANIIRVGNLTNRASDFKFQPNAAENAFLSRVRAALDFGCLPDYLMPLYMEFSPVDDTARAVVSIAKHFNTEQTVFHVNSDRRLYFSRLVEILHELDVPMEVVDGDTFARRLKEKMNGKQAYIYEAFINDLDRDGKLVYDSNIHIENAFTLEYLRCFGFSWTEIDREYLVGYLEYFRMLGDGKEIYFGNRRD